MDAFDLDDVLFGSGHAWAGSKPAAPPAITAAATVRGPPPSPPAVRRLLQSGHHTAHLGALPGSTVAGSALSGAGEAADDADAELDAALAEYDEVIGSEAATGSGAGAAPHHAAPHPDATGTIPIAAILPPHLHAVLPYTRLNAMQSVVYEGIANGTGNIAVSAPTSAGKTAVFDLAILRALAPDLFAVASASSSSGSAQRGKVVYLCPTRALASERQRDWTARYAPLGLQIVCFTGDEVGSAVSPVDDAAADDEDQAVEDEGGSAAVDAGLGDEDGEHGAPIRDSRHLQRPAKGAATSTTRVAAKAAPTFHRTRVEDVAAADIIITTPEKWDATTRRWKDNAALIGQIALVCIDEVHLLNEERGAVLEAVVSRMRTVSASPLVTARGWPAAHLRIVAVSATIPNLSDIGQWINASPEHTYAFDDTYRPVALTTHVLGFDSKGSGFMFERFLSARVYEVIARYASGRPTLVFCASRNGVKSTAEAVVRDGGSLLVTKPQQRIALADAARRVSDGKLRDCLLRGVGFHSAGETAGDRAVIERLFLGGYLPVLCATTTLAMGVNLPAHLVIIKSTQAWRGSADGYAEYPRSTVLQMMVRLCVCVCLCLCVCAFATASVVEQRAPRRSVKRIMHAVACRRGGERRSWHTLTMSRPHPLDVIRRAALGGLNSTRMAWWSS